MRVCWALIFTCLCVFNGGYFGLSIVFWGIHGALRRRYQPLIRRGDASRLARGTCRKHYGKTKARMYHILTVRQRGLLWVDLRRHYQVQCTNI